MKAVKDKLILIKRDYDLLVKYIFSRMTPMSAENKNAEQLYKELEDAKIHENEKDIPLDVIRSNSLVEVEEESTGRKLKFRLVQPGHTNLTNGELSLFAPLGIALIGYRKGSKINWEMPAGDKTFHIKDVINDRL
ncbi:GreA/GreB family elongation factor [Terrimonas pollutisoli]|uniref:GreA/GreB family elongation factor n=1 Tax=Terrimonas pollutisoli TaxID=3034147 RepID=UPI0023EACD0A|nr:GreA/GreB family elongation factor [Terrimonas sp. H1YJ31]